MKDEQGPESEQGEDAFEDVDRVDIDPGQGLLP